MQQPEPCPLRAAAPIFAAGLVLSAALSLPLAGCGGGTSGGGGPIITPPSILPSPSATGSPTPSVSPTPFPSPAPSAIPSPAPSPTPAPPLITGLAVQEPDSVLVLDGTFPAAAGTVTVDGDPVPVLSWSPRQIRCQIPITGMGSDGPVVVSAANGGASSQPHPLTSWGGDVTYTFAAAGTLVYRFVAHIHLRGDMTGGREVRLVPVADTAATFAATGSYTVSTGGGGQSTLTWSGQADLPILSGGASSGSGGGASLLATLEPGPRSGEMQFLASAPGELNLVRTIQQSDGTVQTYNEPGQTATALFIPQLADATGQIPLTLDTDGTIEAGERSVTVPYPLTTGAETATATLSWEMMPTLYSPTGTAAARSR